MKSISRLFLGVAEHLNYRRTLLARDRVRVDIPCLPYASFDNTGTRIYPWGILNLVESVRCFTYSGSAMKGEPDRSFLDFHDILNNHFVFIIGANVNIKPNFHQFEAPKFPLYVVERLKYLGKSSKTMTYELYHSESDTLYVTCDVTDVLVSGDSRKPVAYPDWWLERYGDLMTSEKAKLSTESIPPGKPLVSEAKVKVGDIDTYRHTNWASYIKFCYESLIEHAASDSYECLNLKMFDGSVKSFNLVYKGESNLGDTLTVKSWLSDTQEKRVLFNVLRGGTLCLHCNIDFY